MLFLKIEDELVDLKTCCMLSPIGVECTFWITACILVKLWSVMSV